MYVRDTLTHPAKGLSPSAHPFFSSLLELGPKNLVGYPLDPPSFEGLRACTESAEVTGSGQEGERNYV